MIGRMSACRVRAAQLAEIEALNPPGAPVRVATNMVFVTLNDQAAGGEGVHQLSAALQAEGVAILNMNPLRLVLHKDVNRDDLQKVVAQFMAFFRNG